MLLFGKNKQGLEKTTMHEFCQQTSALLVEQLRLISCDFDYRIDHSGYLIFLRRGSTSPAENKENTEEYEVIQTLPSNTGSEPKLKKKETSEEFIPLEGTPKKKLE